MTAALVMLALTLAGVGRGLAVSAAYGPVATTIGALVVPICGAHRPAAPGPGSPGDRDCHVECALCTAVLHPSPPAFAPRPCLAQAEPREVSGTPVPQRERPRTPRLAQAPPLA